MTRYKHWFQHPKATTYEQRNGTLVIAMFRNPYDWLKAMRQQPHRAPAHLHLYWDEFLAQPWTMERIGTDLNASTTSRCQQDFGYNQVISCANEPLPREAYDHHLQFTEHRPFYEMKQDGSGEPFANILELRAAKIRNFLETKDYPSVVDVWPLRYEDLLSLGTKRLLDKITEKTGIPYKCNPFPIQPPRTKRKLSERYVKFVNKHLDWDAERLIGYSNK